MQTEAGKAVTEVLDVLAAKFGTTATHLWSVMIRQQYVYAVLMLVLCVIFSTTAWRVHRRAGAHFADKDRSTYEDDFYAAHYLLVAVVLILASLSGYDVLTGFFNPEYGALKDVLQAITPND